MFQSGSSSIEHSLVGDDVIRIRACLAAVRDERILLVPHYDTDAGPTQWNVPGGRVRFGEGVRETAIREFREETGLQAQNVGLLDVSEVILPDRPWHSITVTFSGSVTGGELASEAGHGYGEKIPRWFSVAEIKTVEYHPKQAIEKALGIEAK